MFVFRISKVITTTVLLCNCIYSINTQGYELKAHTKQQASHQRIDIFSFSLSEAEITFTQWGACIGSVVCNHHPNNQGWSRDNRQIINQSALNIIHESSLEVGQTLEFLLASEGDPDDIYHDLPDGEHFSSYYYQQSNTSYIINTETGYICAITKGKHNGTCTPFSND